MEKILSAQCIFDKDAYNEGLKAWYNHRRRNYISSISNPYPKETNKWYNWNSGWNTLNDIKNV